MFCYPLSPQTFELLVWASVFQRDHRAAQAKMEQLRTNESLGCTWLQIQYIPGTPFFGPVVDTVWWWVWRRISNNWQANKIKLTLPAARGWSHPEVLGAGGMQKDRPCPHGHPWPSMAIHGPHHVMSVKFKIFWDWSCQGIRLQHWLLGIVGGWLGGSMEIADSS